MIYQSKMNLAPYNAELDKYFERAKSFIFDYTDVNIWHSIDKIPSSIIGEFMQLWDSGVVVKGMKIEMNETDEYYRIVKSK